VARLDSFEIARGWSLSGIADVRVARLKIPPEIGPARYHCMSRTTNGDLLFGVVEKRFLQKLISDAADYCGLKVLTHAVMVNHPHVFVDVPQKLKCPTDAELLRRYLIWYPQPNQRQAARIETIKGYLAADGVDAENWRRRQWAQMGDISQFMKIVKQRFTAYFNKRHNRFGTIWAERFKSELVEENSNATMRISAYIDLNPVRAGLVGDPKDYCFCGYAEAVAGKEAARHGIMAIVEVENWPDAQQAYRKLLFGIGASKGVVGRRISSEDLARVVERDGRLSMAEALRCRIRAFTDSAVLGTKDFVARHLEEFERKHHRKRRTRPRPLPAITDWGDLAVMRGLRRTRSDLNESSAEK
jgi:REP element-mobilizing transposase RayT